MHGFNGEWSWKLEFECVKRRSCLISPPRKKKNQGSIGSECFQQPDPMFVPLSLPHPTLRFSAPPPTPAASLEQRGRSRAAAFRCRRRSQDEHPVGSRDPRAQGSRSPQGCPWLRLPQPRPTPPLPGAGRGPGGGRQTAPRRTAAAGRGSWRRRAGGERGGWEDALPAAGKRRDNNSLKAAPLGGKNRVGTARKYQLAMMRWPTSAHTPAPAPASLPADCRCGQRRGSTQAAPPAPRPPAAPCAAQGAAGPQCAPRPVPAPRQPSLL